MYVVAVLWKDLEVGFQMLHMRGGLFVKFYRINGGV